MIKRLLFTFSLCFIIGTLFSQRSSSGSNFKGGVRAGFTSSQISGDDLAGFHKFGAYAGGYVNFPITENMKWKIQPEINFIMKGSHTYETKDYVAPNIYALNLWYMEVPVLIKWDFFKGFGLEFGPTFNVLIYQAEKDANGIMMSRQPFRWYELSVVIGINYLIKEHYGINLRWSSSFIPVRVPDFVYNRAVKKQFNDVIAFSLYYQF
ncbi:MAG: porin family protein [Bacteroidales bacterium]